MVTLLSYAENSDDSFLVSIQITEDSASRLAAKPFFTMIESYFSPTDEIASGLVKIQVGDDFVILEYFDSSKSEIPLCSSGIRVTADILVMDDETITTNTFLKRMTNYAEAARLTESTAGVYFEVSEDLKFSRFFDVVAGMSAAGVSRILITSYKSENAEKNAAGQPASRPAVKNN